MEDLECAGAVDPEIIALCVSRDVQGIYDVIIPIAQLAVLLAVIIAGVLFARRVVKEFAK